MSQKRVSKTLGLALKYLRRKNDRVLWIDAICINQANKEERSYQVSMMSLVYTRAECSDQKNAHKWRAFLRLMQRSWFSRRWVVQEIALAFKARVYCGPDELDWRELAIAVELFVEVETATHRLSELLRKDAKMDVVPNWFEHISELGASLLVNATARIFREYQRGDQVEGLPARRSLLSLEYLVTSLSIFDCGRPHDSVYALIAIARDAKPNPPTSYWNIQIPGRSNAVSDFIKLAFPRRNDVSKDPAAERKPSLRLPRQSSTEQEKEWQNKEKLIIDELGPDPRFEDILRAKEEIKAIDRARLKAVRGKDRRGVKVPMARDNSRVQESGLPSWVAKIDGAPFDIFHHPGMDMVKMGRKNADPLVGTPQDGHRNYSAGQSRKVDLETLQIKRRPHLGHYSLYVKGFCFDKVAEVAQVSQAGAILASWLDLAGWSEARRPTGVNGDIDDPPTAFWRTLVADRGLNDRNPPYYYARACKETILKGGIRSNAVDTTALIFNERNSIIAEFCRRVQSVIWNRALIKTEKGALGLVTEEVKQGDLICVIYGCTVPVILRRNNANFKTKNEQDAERLEDGIEAMKRLVAKKERYRDRASRYQKKEDKMREKIMKEMNDYNAKHPPANDFKERREAFAYTKKLDKKRQKLGGDCDSQIDMEGEDTHDNLEEEEEQVEEQVQEQGEEQVQEQEEEQVQEQEEEQVQEQEEEQVQEQEEEQVQEQEEEEKEDPQQKMIERNKQRQRLAKLRDPLRHYRFLDQAYIHGMMDGEAVRQKFYNGKSDHIFEIR
ncbi:hypothetical protein T440DRAFT_544500 [Plenodomus tracheiphilus IPT5]|uniref:Heterokaryon incompatibility domain-containing protein n=1 Tax=Plenodomus tracheiphilus IPT5 TaxID=1408161 RepID=A0A6A7BFG2_9PLEO|nr:hypothetical protein T440DRAFT_544500 [Plenodomus tracheiphilus IPT5]